jgi:hypothetical protein
METSYQQRAGQCYAMNHTRHRKHGDEFAGFVDFDSEVKVVSRLITRL